MGLSPQWLDELRARTTLSALIGRNIKVTKAGREFKACCPFHNEKTPSFTINDEKGFYHCFGCSAHGDAIRWMTDQRGLSFMDAVKELADAAGMEVPAADPKAAAKAEHANTLYDVMTAAQNWFVQTFLGLEGADARAYCEKRGLKAETLKAFGVGFAPDSRSKLKESLKQFGEDKLVEAGLLIAVDGKEPYDRFRGRLMIPIRDPRGRVIAFGGRILGAGEPKYLNSPDTPLFDKGRTLYNFDKAAPAARKTNRLIVVEGYMDVLALAQEGFNDAVAPLGTALTEQQLALMWKLSSAPVICFDGDAAGQKASERAALRALPGLRPDRSLTFARLPDGQDPDDLLRTGGRTALDLVLGIAQSLSDFVWFRYLKGLPSSNPGPNDRALLMAMLEDAADKISDQNLASEYRRSFRQLFFDKFGFKKETIKRVGAIISDALHAQIFDIRTKVHRAILLGLSRYPRVILQKLEDIAELPIYDPLLKQMRNDILIAAVEQPHIEQDMIEQLWLTDRSPPFKPRDLQSDLAYSFYYKQVEREKPESDLFLLIGFVANELKLERNIAMAREELNKNPSEDAAKKCREFEQKRAQNRSIISDLAISADDFEQAFNAKAA